MSKNAGWAATSPTSPLAPYTFERRDVRPDDVEIEIIYCGICHSDIHVARNEWPETIYPVVPGHEIVGKVRTTGANVTKFDIGDLVGVGCMVDACLKCDECKAGLEQHCIEGCTWTYNSIDDTGQYTQGGYSDSIVVRERFVVKVPESLDLAQAAPLLCAGITTYSPLRHYKVGEGTRVGVAGLGGLGDMAVKLAKAMGAHVTVLTRSPQKADAARAAGADDIVDVNDAHAMSRINRTLEVIISTIPKTHDVEPYLELLGLDGAYVIVGAIEPMLEPYDSRKLISRRAILTGSSIGGIKETQELLDFCAEKGIVSTVEVIPAERINEVYDRISAGEVAHRFVIDASTFK